jgi:hypothetical protein
MPHLTKVEELRSSLSQFGTVKLCFLYEDQKLIIELGDVSPEITIEKVQEEVANVYDDRFRIVDSVMIGENVIRLVMR